MDEQRILKIMNEFELFIDLLKGRPYMVLGNHRGKIDDMAGAIALFIGTLQMDRGKLHDVLNIPKFMQWFSTNKPLGAESFIQWILNVEQENTDEGTILNLFIQTLERSKSEE